MKKPQFAISRKNQNGQVAIFVALIFQVIFVLFALLINVGLIVHHKINLQQSTDLAAYYGAMKQAEGLNAIAHINYQLRQNWKLFAWRYRVLGTFGFQNTNNPADPNIKFPVKIHPDSSVLSEINANQVSGSCPTGTGENISITTHPFFCIGHAGMKGWYSNAENNCKVNCQILESTTSYNVNGIPGMQVIIGNGISNNINTTFESVNHQLGSFCNALGSTNIKVLAKMVLGYQREAQMRSGTLLMLAANLSKENFYDLDGGEVQTGVRTTLLNNLTEANRTSIGSNTNRIQMYNSLNDPDCAMDSDVVKSGSNLNGKSEFLKRIEFNLVQLYIHDCLWVSTGGAASSGYQSFRSGSVYNKTLDGLADGVPVGTVPTPNLTAAGDDIKNAFLELILTENKKHTVGYEKNPWCPAYYFVSATAEPMIPFLPLVKIKLSAHAAAKPFGGSVGPWYGKTWRAGEKTTQVAGFTGFENNNQTDLNLPVARNTNGAATSRKDSMRLMPNFSRFVGDTQGLSDPLMVAEYHAALIDRYPSNIGIPGYSNNKVNEPANPTPGHLRIPNDWPSMFSWDNSYLPESPDYDALATVDATKDSGLRDLEISAIAPNQFDLTYYSIDPDFYNNYYLRILSNYNKLRTGYDPGKIEYIRPDFGNGKVYQKTDFSVRNQMEIVKKIIGNFKTTLVGSKNQFMEATPFLATKQSSLLTGWTFQRFTKFDEFPEATVGSPLGTMTFGRCDNVWAQTSDPNNSYGNPKNENSNLEPVPGNCITGGRVGYSVKLVAPNSLRENVTHENLGGASSGNTPILNPIPSSKFSY